MMKMVEVSDNDNNDNRGAAKEKADAEQQEEEDDFLTSESQVARQKLLAARVGTETETGTGTLMESGEKHPGNMHKLQIIILLTQYPPITHKPIVTYHDH